MGLISPEDSHEFTGQGALFGELCEDNKEEEMDPYGHRFPLGVPQYEMLQVLHTGL